jgi:hypothetical protein
MNSLSKGFIALTVMTGLWLRAAADPASPVAGQSTEQQRERLLYRLYSATFGADEFGRKAAPKEWPGFRLQLDCLTARYPEFVQLLRESPYYAQAAAQFSNKAEEMRIRETPQTASADCVAFTQLLKELVDEPAGPQAILGYEAQLAAPDAAPDSR